MSTKVKICGVTRLDEAIAAAEAGADFVGFNFYPPSPRAIPESKCSMLTGELARRGIQIAAVGVFVNHAESEIRRIMSACRLDYAQLSGDEPPELLSAFRNCAFKAIRPETPQDALEQADQFANPAVKPALLLDGYKAGRYGGTGLTPDLQAARMLADRCALMLAGGLTPENVAAAVAAVRPWAVDVASGVESAPGRKDADKVRRFIENAKGAIEEQPWKIEEYP